MNPPSNPCPACSAPTRTIVLGSGGPIVIDAEPNKEGTLVLRIEMVNKTPTTVAHYVTAADRQAGVLSFRTHAVTCGRGGRK